MTAEATGLSAAPRRYHVREADVPGYHPANHTGTLNRRLIGRDTVGAESVEMLIGTIDKGSGALPHAHPGIDQICYLLEGTATAEVDGQRFAMQPGDACFFPAGMEHVFTVASDKPVRVLIVYTPPYEENPQRVVRRR